MHYEVQKSQHGHKDVFPVTLSFMQRSDLQIGHLSEDRSRSFARVIASKKRLCVCVVCFRMLWELVHIEHSFWKGEHTFLSD